MSAVRGTIAAFTAVAWMVVLAGLALPDRGAAQQGQESLGGAAFGSVDVASTFGRSWFPEDRFVGGGLGGLLYIREHRLATLALRAEGSVADGGRTFRNPGLFNSDAVEFVGRTNHSVLSGGVGPQVLLGSGRIKPYFFGTIGFSYFATSSEVSQMYHGVPIRSSTSHSDYRLALAGGGGLSIEIRGGRNPLGLDLSASYKRNGRVERARLFGIPPCGFPCPVQAVILDTRMNLMTYRVGLSVGVR